MPELEARAGDQSQGARRFTLGSQGAGRFTRGSQGARRLTRDSRIPAHFFVKKFQKNRKNRFFGLPGPK